MMFNFKILVFILLFSSSLIFWYLSFRIVMIKFKIHQINCQSNKISKHFIKAPKILRWIFSNVDYQLLFLSSNFTLIEDNWWLFRVIVVVCGNLWYCFYLLVIITAKEQPTLILVIVARSHMDQTYFLGWKCFNSAVDWFTVDTIWGYLIFLHR